MGKASPDSDNDYNTKPGLTQYPNNRHSKPLTEVIGWYSGYGVALVEEFDCESDHGCGIWFSNTLQDLLIHLADAYPWREKF